MGTKHGEWETLASKTVHQNAFYSVREDEVVKPDGSKGTYHVVAMNHDNRVYLVGLHRYTTDKYSIEIPAGGTEGEGNDPLAAAKRELQEEAGLVAENWKRLATVYPAKGLLSEKNYVYLATGLSRAHDDEQDVEGITKTLKVTLPEAFAMVKDGKITDEQTITGLTLAALELEIPISV